MSGPLDGIRVLDFTRVVAGPLASRILADQGAEVIKIEPPDGDLSRTFPPLAEDGVTPYFAQQNAGKRFCSVDFRAPGATELLRELAAECDVVIENYRPGVMERFGLGADDLCAADPRLVYCSVTGFGQTGPWAQRRAYAPIGHLESGLLAHDRAKIDRPARQPAIVLGDAVTAMMAAASINALLVQAARRGDGGRLDVCMVESLVYIQEWVSTELAGGWHTTNNGACDQCPVLDLGDGRFWGIAGNPLTWFTELIEVMGRPELIDDQRFSDPEIREHNRADFIAMVTEWAAEFETFDEFCRTLEANSPFTAAELRTIDELVETEWSVDRELVTSTTAGFRVPARPASGADIGTNGYVAARGADNRDVLAQVLGYDAADLAELEASGVLVAG